MTRSTALVTGATGGIGLHIACQFEVRQAGGRLAVLRGRSHLGPAAVGDSNNEMPPGRTCATATARRSSERGAGFCAPADVRSSSEAQQRAVFVTTHAAEIGQPVRQLLDSRQALTWNLLDLAPPITSVQAEVLPRVAR